MQQGCTMTGPDATPSLSLSRGEIAATVRTSDETAKKLGISQRLFARLLGVPHSTFQDWVKREARIDATPAERAFFGSPEGVAFLHRIVLAAQLVITLLGPGSIRQVCVFLVLSGLSRFVASSYGYQQKTIAALERELGLFGEQERERLGHEMKPKKITIIEDETFHPQPCLVAMEGASGFIVLEKYADNRDWKTWTRELQAALGELPVEIVQGTSDEGSGLLKHQREGLKGHHSPDLFHPQQDLIWGTSVSMKKRVKDAHGRVTKAEEFTQRLEENTAEYEASGEPKPWCSLESMHRNIEQAKADEEAARKDLAEAEERQEKMSQAIRDISTSYHPFDPTTGAARSAEQVETDMEGHFENIDDHACEAGLSERCFELIAKARRVVPLMVATIAFFHETVRGWVEELGLTEELERFVLGRWIPGRYLELVASRAKTAEERSRLRQAAAKVIPSVQEIERMLSSLCEQDRLLLASLVEQCAQLFRRSSSCVEGRNGHLSLFHHGLHRLMDRKLEALTIIHNYMKVRPDGTTAAERFFGQPPRGLFEWLLERMPLPAYPARPRRKAAS